jgi:regulator of replication initiation timing
MIDNNITARLRAWSADESTWDLLTEAADEIERMRERRDDWRAAMTENHDLWNENERLRARIEALEGEIRETAEASND